MCKKACFLACSAFVLWLISSASAALVARYNFEGNVQDSSGSGFHGTVIDGAIEYVAGGSR